MTTKISDQPPIRTLIIALCWTHRQQIKMLGASTGRVHEFWPFTAFDNIESAEAPILVAVVFDIPLLRMSLRDFDTSRVVKQRLSLSRKAAVKYLLINGPKEPVRISQGLSSGESTRRAFQKFESSSSCSNLLVCMWRETVHPARPRCRTNLNRTSYIEPRDLLALM